MNYVAYYPGSRADVAVYTGGRLVGTYIERGGLSRLVAAVGRCRETGATLVIGRIGRRVLNPRFLALLTVPFVCLDNPTCTPETVARLLMAAEEATEAKRLRIREVMAELKKRGVKLGSARPGHWKGQTRGTKQAIAASVKARGLRAKQAYAFILPTMKQMRSEGKTMDEVAAWLNQHGHKTTTGGPFGVGSVWRLLKCYAGKKYLGPVKDHGGHPLVIGAMRDN